MIVRRAVYADLPAIHVAFGHLVVELEQYRLVGYPGHDQQTVEDFTVHLAGRVQTDPRLLLYVALEDDTHVLLGFLGGEIAERVIGHPTRFGAAHWLYVAPSARGQGVARALVRLACADLAAAGITHVELASLSGDDQWLRRGWAPFLIHCVLPLSAVAVAAAAERPAVPEPEPEPAPVPPPAMEPEPVVELPPLEPIPPLDVGANGNGAAPRKLTRKKRRKRRKPRRRSPAIAGPEPCA